MNLNVKSVLTICSLLSVFLTSTARAEVVMNGLEGKTKENALALLALTEQPCTAPNWKIQRLFAQADAEIDRSLRALGYYQFKLKKNLTVKDDCWLAEFTVELGQQTTVKTISIAIEGDAKNDAEFLKLVQKYQAKIGSPLQHSFYESIKARFNALAQEHGYLQGKWKQKQLLIDKARAQAEFKLVFDSGKQHRFGKVEIKQQVLDPELAKKYSALVADKPYNASKLVETYDALSKSGYFEQVEIRPDFQRAESQRVPIAISLYPKDKHHYSFGLGYGTDVGVLVNAFYENRRLNTDGDTFSANLDASLVLSTLETQYNIPLDNPLSDSYTFGAGLKREKTDNFTSQSATLSNRLKYGLADGWKQTLFADFSYEKFTIQQEKKQSLLFILGGNWLNSFSNNMMHPTEGRRLRVDLGGSYETPLSNVSFLRANLDGVWMTPLPWSGVFTGRMNLGAMTVNKFNNLPTSYRFYAGGINSVRGYDYKELAPKDGLGNVAGGKFSALLSAEYEQTLFGDYGVAAFIDTGNAFNLDNISIKTGAGIGLRWYSPIGPIRLDFAIPLNDANSSYQIYFAAGTRL